MILNHRDALSGALVADAASLGLHWLYEPRQITKLEACGNLLFNSFGPCGSFVGYADRPTKSLVANIIQQGDDISDSSGINDDQMPAMSVVPGLFSVKTDASKIALAASVISTHSHVSEGVAVLLSCLNSLANGSPMAEALEKSISSADDTLAALLRKAIDSGDDESTVSEHFGRACKVYQGMPLSWYLLSRFDDFESVALANVRCGGDNCGRAMIIGTIAGFAYGVPGHLIHSLINERVPINYP